MVRNIGTVFSLQGDEPVFSSSDAERFVQWADARPSE
jgi:hypothetical protein